MPRERGLVGERSRSGCLEAGLASHARNSFALRRTTPDPHRPRVRVLFDPDGARLDLPFERNLWEPQGDRSGEALESVIAPVDPGDYHVDPLNFLEKS